MRKEGDRVGNLRTSDGWKDTSFGNWNEKFRARSMYGTYTVGLAHGTWYVIVAS
jgi:hypothetical protein